MTAPNSPIVNRGVPYSVGLSTISIDSVSKILVGNGFARDTTDINDIVLPNATTLDLALNGPNGLDFGSIANDGKYYIYVIGDSTKYLQSATIASLNSTAPNLPFGYDMYARIGFVLFDSGGAMRTFVTGGDGLTKEYSFDEPLIVVNGGTSGSFADFDYSVWVPFFADTVTFQISMSTATAQNEVYIRRKGSLYINGTSRFYAPMLTSPSWFETYLVDNEDSPFNGMAQYKIDGSDPVSIYVRGFNYNMGKS